MQYIISGENIDVTEGLKAAVQDKLGKLERYFTPETEVHVTLSVEKERQKIEITIPMKGNIVRAEQVSDDMYVSIDMAVDLLERMIRKYKTKISKYGKGELKFNDEFMEEDVDNHETVTITKSKRFAIKPMDVEDQVVSIYAASHGYMEDVPIDEIKEFETELLAYIRVSYPEIKETIAKTGQLDEETEQLLTEAIKKFKEMK